MSDRPLGYFYVRLLRTACVIKTVWSMNPMRAKTHACRSLSTRLAVPSSLEPCQGLISTQIRLTWGEAHDQRWMTF